PVCGMFQSEMVPLLRRECLPRLKADGTAAIAAGIGFGLFLLIISLLHQPPREFSLVGLSASTLAWPLVAVPVAVGITLLRQRASRASRFHPHSERDSVAARAIAAGMRSAPGAGLVVAPDVRKSGPGAGFRVEPGGKIHDLRKAPDRD